MVNHPNRSKRPKWVLLADAPSNVVGLLWGPALRDRTDMTGLVRHYADGEALASCAQSSTIQFTHWHALPPPPVSSQSGDGE